MKLNILKVEKKLNIKIKNKSLLLQALTHKSSNKLKNNEKLEFLGDRVIGLVLSKKILDMYPNDDEGILDKKFAKLVNRETCASIAWNIGLKNFIIIGNKKNIVRNDEKILSDACEALIGAIYIDQGFDYVKKFVLNLWQNDLKKSHLTILDAKTELQEYSLKLYKKLPMYRLLSTKGPRHNPTFKVGVCIKGSKEFIGTGNSKQEAEQKGADNLLKNIDR
tara:strand:- start:14 stop:676 length:663 start_codon:yes stop_codon:yes gene_type:complete